MPDYIEPPMRTEADMVSDLNFRVDMAGGQVHFARKHGISQSYVSDAINGRRPLGGTLAAVLGYERVVRYRKLPELQP